MIPQSLFGGMPAKRGIGALVDAVTTPDTGAYVTTLSSLDRNLNRVRREPQKCRKLRTLHRELVRIDHFINRVSRAVDDLQLRDRVKGDRPRSRRARRIDRRPARSRRIRARNQSQQQRPIHGRRIGSARRGQSEISARRRLHGIGPRDHTRHKQLSGLWEPRISHDKSGPRVRIQIRRGRSGTERARKSFRDPGAGKRRRVG